MQEQSGIFVRPNLKGFLVGGLILMGFHFAMQQLEGISVGAPRPPVPSSVNMWSEEDFQTMQSYVVDRPTSEGYYKLGAYLEHKRDFKRAMIYLKKAQALALLDEESE